MEKYEKIKVVGRGAFGIVHLCRRRSDDALVILKEIPVEQMTRDERLAAQNECQVLKLLSHPNIIKYYENFLEDKALMIAMEYAPGGTLADYIQKRCNSLLDEETILHFFVQILLALYHVHNKLILHRDLKTQNILLDKHQMIVKIGDFGISKILNLPALVLKIMSGTFAPISDRYSPELRQLILNMLNLDPSKRPQLNEMMAHPICIKPLLSLYTDIGYESLFLLSWVVMPGVLSTLTSTKMLHPLPLSSVYTWGSGISNPLRLPMLNTEVIQVSLGRTQKMGVTKSGRLITWEAPLVGSVEPTLPGAVEQMQPQFISRFLEGQSGVTITSVSCGDLFTTCLTDRGIIMTFGSGSNGCLGHGNFNDVTQPKIVEALLGYELVQVACGASHVLAVTNEREIFSWGRGDNGRLGLGTLDSHNCPQQVSLPVEFEAQRVLCGIDCSMIISTQHQIMACGNNRFNKLGLDQLSDSNQASSLCLVEEVHAFQLIKSAPLNTEKIVCIDIGTAHSVAVTEKGQCLTFGSNQHGQLGCSSHRNSRVPYYVSGLQGITMAACGDAFTLAVGAEGEVYTWGKGARGRLGRKEEDSGKPKPVHLDESHPFTHFLKSLDQNDVRASVQMTSLIRT
ncbi:hypothetical protein DNTS_029976 [Danionella cerebrum]|uniref:non-specific serine/threonine protein kinase n=1 Tax=Danionella cerebrum TaxID=2873325 RepID=A0A553RFJ4_9TELE|nr:hypothetical protein DNTS_029976 [Danionella translucida]